MPEGDLVGIGLAEDVLNGLVDGVDGVGVLVGDLNAEFLLNGHDDLNGVEAVEAEVVGEVSGGLDVGSIVDLVETLEQANDAALDLLLLQATASAVHADGNNSLDTGGHGDARSSHCRSSDNVRGGRAGGGADGRAEDSCAEHDE